MIKYARGPTSDIEEVHSTGDRSKRLLLALFETTLELVHASAGIDELLLTGVERMALGADFNSDLSGLRGTGNDRLAASALYRDFLVFGMDSFLNFMNTSHILLQFPYAMIHTI